MNGDDLTVLLVGTLPPIEGLIEELEALELVVELSPLDELESLLPLVEPELVLFTESRAALSVIRAVREFRPDNGVALLAIANDEELAELRGFDPSIVDSILGTDTATKLVASTAAALAKKRRHRSNERKHAARKECGEDQAPPTARPHSKGQVATGASDESPEEITRATLDSPRVKVVVCDTNKERRGKLRDFFHNLEIPCLDVPLNVAETDWSLIKTFDPEFFVADNASLERDGAIWLQMLRADRTLANKELITLNFDDLFVDEKIDQARCTNHLPQLPIIPPRLPALPEEELWLDAPPFDAPPRPEMATDNPTPELDASFETPQRQSSRAQVDSPTFTTSTPPPKLRKIPVLPLLVAVGVLLGATGIWLNRNSDAQSALDHGISAKNAPPSVSSTRSGETSSSVTPEEVPNKQDPSSVHDAPRDREIEIWRIDEHKSLPSCEELVQDPEKLKLGGMARAKSSWNLAKGALNRGQLAQAQQFMCEAVTIYPESLALEGLVDLALSRGAPQSAQRWLAQALSYRGDRSRTKLLSGDVESQLGHQNQARDIWLDALGVSANSTETLSKVAKGYWKEATSQLKLGDTTSAERLYRRAAALSPDDADALSGLAKTNFVKGNSSRAKTWAELALKVDPAQVQAMLVMGDISVKLRDLAKARAWYEQVLTIAPRHGEALLRLAQLGD